MGPMGPVGPAGSTGLTGTTGPMGPAGPAWSLPAGFDLCSKTAVVCPVGLTRDTAMEAVLKNGNLTVFCCKAP